ncbi:diacylglycerol kinase family protein [Streptomyces boluensis]|uniref:diacylglycerol kinase family protein n=1 Tax=Streptomyces boluensis TaxID=1775135 RepID=UPI0028A99F9D|nr:diacylglycerol kinase family protein [Streptomyces boluensis]
MSAPEPAGHSAQPLQPSTPLLVVIDPAARAADGEAVRIARDVLCAGAEGGPAKVCLPDGPEEFARALTRRGSRRPVVVGDDGALLRAVTVLHRERELASAVLSLVPVGAATGLAHALGVPTGTVAAARAVLDGAPRRLDLLVDDSDGVVIGRLAIPAGASMEPDGTAAPGSLLGTCRSLVRTLVRPAPQAPSAPGTARLRVEADGVTLADLDQPVEAVSVRTLRGGLARVEVRAAAAGSLVRAQARTVTVSGPDFRYRADTTTAGPVRARTWTVRPGAWALTLPS